MIDYHKASLALWMVAMLALSVPMVLVPHPGTGSDFLVFRSAALALERGGNPYHLSALDAAIRSTVPGVHHILPAYAFVYPVWSLPLLFSWSTLVSLQVGYYLWFGINLVSVILAGRWLSEALGWKTKRWVVMTVALLPAALITYIVGQVDGILLGLVTVAILGITHERPLLAGVAVGLAVALKVDVCWPLAFFVPLAALPNWKQAIHLLAAELGTGVICLGVPMLWFPWWFTSWLHRLVGFSHGVAAKQPDLAGVDGLIRLLPPELAPGSFAGNIGIAAVLFAGLFGMGWWGLRLYRGRSLANASLQHVAVAVTVPMSLWLLVSPYAHTDDTLLLIPLGLWLLSDAGGHPLRMKVITLFCLLVPPTYTLVAASWGLLDHAYSFTALGTAGLLALTLWALRFPGSHRLEFAPATLRSVGEGN